MTSSQDPNQQGWSNQPDQPHQPGQFNPPPGPAQSQPQSQPYGQQQGGYGPPPGQYGYPPAPSAPYGGYVPGSTLMLPPGVTLAPVGRRIGAYFLAIPLAIITLGIGYLIWGLVVWGKGTTPALSVLGMKVWRLDTNRPATFGTMALREIIGRIVDGILSFITLIISFVMFVSSEHRQALHDKIASTTVVYDPNKVLG